MEEGSRVSLYSCTRVSRCQMRQVSWPHNAPPLIMNAIGMTYRRTRTYCRTVRSNPLPVSFSHHYTRLVLRWKETPLCDLAGQYGIPLARVTHMHHQPRNSLSPMATRMHGDPQDREARREECRAPLAAILCRSPVLHLRPSCEDDCNAAPRPPVDSDVGACSWRRWT